MSKAIISKIMQVASPLEQILITHVRGLSGYNILEFCQVVLEKKIFKALH